VTEPDPRPSMTVSQVLAAHAMAQIAAAQDSDLAGRRPAPPAKTATVHCASFTVSWASAGMCIGFSKPAAN
jgi:hypothetical protein